MSVTRDYSLMRHSSGVTRAASQWDARLRSPDCSEEDRRRFAAWRDESREHREAFERLQQIVTEMRANLGRADVRGLREAALGVSARRRRLRAFAAAVALVAVGAAAWLVVPSNDGSDSENLDAVAEHPDAAALRLAGIYQTGTGETSAVTLLDGSTVTLNARSRIKVTIDRERRGVELIEGQALFQVARDPGRSFVVRAADRDITAVGTAFDVRLDATSVRVTLLEGKLRVSRDDARLASERILAPGQQLVAGLPATAEPVVRVVDVAKVTGWRDGRIFLEDLTLASAVAEMNRYSTVQIRVEDPLLADLRVNGMFRAGEQEAFVTALQDYFPIRAARTGDVEIALTRDRRD